MLAACGTREDAILDSDASGYICSKCDYKFYITGGQPAAQCPKCGDSSIEEVVAYVCPADHSVTVVPKSAMGAPCLKCGKFTNEKKLPTTDELKTWGAVKS